MQFKLGETKKMQSKCCVVLKRLKSDKTLYNVKINIIILHILFSLLNVIPVNIIDSIKED